MRFDRQWLELLRRTLLQRVERDQVDALKAFASIHEGFAQELTFAQLLAGLLKNPRLGKLFPRLPLLRF
jgi:hypothetical protein